MPADYAPLNTLRVGTAHEVSQSTTTVLGGGDATSYTTSSVSLTTVLGGGDATSYTTSDSHTSSLASSTQTPPPISTSNPPASSSTSPVVSISSRAISTLPSSESSASTNVALVDPRTTLQSLTTSDSSNHISGTMGPVPTVVGTSGSTTDKLSVGAIGGIAIGSCVLLLAAVAFFVREHRKREELAARLLKDTRYEKAELDGRSNRTPVLELAGTEIACELEGSNSGQRVQESDSRLESACDEPLTN